MLRLLWQELIFRRNGIIGWGLGLTFFPLVYVLIYPEFAGDLASMQSFLESDIYRVMGVGFGTFEDWVASTIILFVPMLAAVYALINGTGTLAGEEDDGRLEMIVTLPIPRWQIVVVKAVALIIALFFILFFVALVTIGVFLAIESKIETTLVPADILKALLTSGWALAAAIGMISLFLATISPSRRVAALLGAMVIIVSYFGSNLSGMVSSLESIQPLFLFTYLDATGNILLEGPEISDVLVLVGVGFVALVLAVFFFQRRDITVGVWPWQKGRIPAGA